MISIVIPAYNEEEAVSLCVSQIRGVMEAADLGPHEVIVVADGCSDATAANAAAAGAKVVTHLQNHGYGRSLKSGIEAAKYDTIVITDADGTYPAERIPELFALYQEGYDMVVAQRTGEHYKESWIKNPLRKALRFLVEFISGKKIPDINSGLRIFSKKTAVTFFERLCDGFSFTTSITLAYFMNTKTVAYLPVEYRKRIGETKVRLFSDSLRTIQYVIQAVTYYDPLKIFILLSLVTLSVSAVCFLMTLLLSLVSTFYIGVGGVIAAILIFAMGLLADLLKQIMDK
jgi:glycosyltransferase involved in cell wall biosynthesis